MRARRVPWGLVRGEVNGYYMQQAESARPPAPPAPPAGGARENPRERE